MMNKAWNFLLVVAIAIQSCSEPISNDRNLNFPIVPQVTHVSSDNDSIHVKGRFKAINQLQLPHPAQILFDEAQFAIDSDEETSVFYVTDTLLNREEYQLSIGTKGIEIKGRDLQAQIWGTQTLLQLFNESYLPALNIVDQPAYGYRALMIDLSRNWHDIATLKQLISLCSYYKINYLQMHLTDDALFTFPSTNFWQLASKQSYNRDQLYELNQYAHARGVVLIPEIDVPGHSSGFIRALPSWFGLEDPKANPYTLNMGSERMYHALDKLFTDVADAFPFSPYIHVGGDEVFLEGFAEDKGVREYMEAKDLGSLDELYHHFIVRASDMVKSKGKIPIIWSDFTNEGKVKIPKDVIVMSWKPSEYLPSEMLEDGYSLINASWKPLYVVNNRKWSPEEIYEWAPNVWKGSQTPTEKPGHITSMSDKIMGGSMSAWEQNQYKAYESLKRRLPVMAERLWFGDTLGFENFRRRNEIVADKLDQKLFPFDLKEDGLYFPGLIEPNFREDMWFNDSLKVYVSNQNNSIETRYAVGGEMPNSESAVLIEPMVITEQTDIAFQAFSNGKPIGRTQLKSYELVPVNLTATGVINAVSPKSWEKHKFLDSITVTLASDRIGTIRYTTDNSLPTNESALYTQPFSVSHSGYVRAALFDKAGFQIGKERWEEYEQLQLEESLTTGKPITTSNKFEAGSPSMVTDGKITRWDHWGSHTNGNNWVIVDLEEEQTIDTFKTYTFWDGNRYYEYTIEVSKDNVQWDMVVDRSKNKEKSVSSGSCDQIEPVQVRYLKLNLIRNSANPGLHLVEFQAFDSSSVAPNCIN